MIKNFLKCLDTNWSGAHFIIRARVIRMICGAMSEVGKSNRAAGVVPRNTQQ